MKASSRGCLKGINAAGILILLLASVGLVHAGTYGVLTYAVHGTTIEITDCDEAATGSLTVPVEIEGKPVATIGNQAFMRCDALTGITLPNGVVSVGNQSFMHCWNLMSISLPEGLASIGSEAFGYCHDLTGVVFPESLASIGRSAFSFCDFTSITIPLNVVSIGESPFFSCKSLVSIPVDNGNPYYSSVDGVLFDQTITELIQYPCAKGGAYVIPSSVTNIAKSAFAYSTMTSIDFPAGISSLDDYVFFFCDDLEHITVDGGNQYYASANGVLFNKAVSELIKCPAGKTGAYTVPLSVSSINDLSFQSCSGLTNIILPDSLASIGYRSFEDYDGLAGIILPDGISSIGERAFSSCDELSSVVIPVGIVGIGNRPFTFCDNLESITVESENSYFASVDGVLFNKSLTTLIQCPAGKTGTYTFPESVGSIDDGAFSGCDRLTEIVFPYSLNSIGGYSFHNCYGLTSISLPNHLTSIDYSAFYNCGGLTNATFMGDAPTVGRDIFDRTASAFTVYYFSHNTGFTSPTWQGYPAQPITEPLWVWLNYHEYPIDADMGQDLSGDGVALLTAYALDLDPHQDLSESLPLPEIGSGSLNMSFYAGAEGVEYIVETSVNLVSWSTAGVSLSVPDAESFRTASVSLNSPCRFLCLRFVGE